MTPNITSEIDQQRDVELRRKESLASVGMLEVMRLKRPVSRKGNDLRLTGTPIKLHHSTREVEVSFVQGHPPLPELDGTNGSIHMFYREEERAQVEDLLMSKRERFCYFWRSRDGSQRHAWLITSPKG